MPIVLCWISDINIFVNMVYIEKYQRFIPYIIIAILILLLFFKCNSGTEINIQNAILKKENTILKLKKDKVKIVIREKFDTITKIETKIKNNTKIVYVKIDSLRQLNTKGITNYYRTRYNVVQEVNATNLGTALNDSVAILNITELVKYDNCLIENNLKDDIIENHKFIESQQDTIIDFVEKQNKNLENMNKNSEGLIKKERRKALFYQIALAIVSVLATAEIIQK